MKILLIGIFLICLNGFTGSTFDTITKFLSINNYKWYHYYSIGGTVAIITLLIFLFLQGKIQKHILLKKKRILHLTSTKRLTFCCYRNSNILLSKVRSYKYFYNVVDDNSFLSFNFCKIYFKRKT